MNKALIFPVMKKTLMAVGVGVKILFDVIGVLLIAVVAWDTIKILFV